MKATGIVRKIDDLGRVVIPKEIRKTMGIKEGDPLEIYIDGKFICFKKYLVERNWEMAHSVANAMLLNNFLSDEFQFALYDENFERKTTTSNIFDMDGSKIDSEFIQKIPDDLGWIAVNFDDCTDALGDIANVLAEILKRGN